MTGASQTYMGHVFRGERVSRTCATSAGPTADAVDTAGAPIGDRGASAAGVRGMPIEDVTTTVIEEWLAGSIGSRHKLLIQLHGILGRARRAYGLPGNAAAEVERFAPLPRGEIGVFSPGELGACPGGRARAGRCGVPDRRVTGFWVQPVVACVGGLWRVQPTRDSHRGREIGRAHV